MEMVFTQKHYKQKVRNINIQAQCINYYNC